MAQSHVSTFIRFVARAFDLQERMGDLVRQIWLGFRNLSRADNDVKVG